MPTNEELFNQELEKIFEKRDKKVEKYTIFNIKMLSKNEFSAKLYKDTEELIKKYPNECSKYFPNVDNLKPEYYIGRIAYKIYEAQSINDLKFIKANEINSINKSLLENDNKPNLPKI